MKRVLAPEELFRAAQLHRWAGEKSEEAATGVSAAVAASQDGGQPSDLWKKATFVAGR